MTRLVLASRSAIRQKLLRDAGVEFDVDAADVDEDGIGRAESDAKARAMKLAVAKAMVTSARNPGRIVLGADQVGVLAAEGGKVFLEKPVDEADHVRMLVAMAGRTHTFHPAAVLVRDGAVLVRIADSVSVQFREFSEDVARAYAKSGEGRGSCGGYESENRGAQLISRIDGSAHAVLGLPLLLVLAALRRYDVDGVYA